MKDKINGGKDWVFGDDIDTDQLAPGRFMKASISELASHCLEGINEKFATNVKTGDVLVAGKNFGIGSSREQASQALKYLGVSALVAQSYGGIFFRNAINFGLLAVVCTQAKSIQQGDEISINSEIGTVHNLTRNETYVCEKLPSQLLDILKHGGLIPHLEKTLKEKEQMDQSIREETNK